MLAQSCLAFEISCETILKGGLTVVIAFVLFVGSVLLVLAAVFGRRMGYLVLAVGFFGWMIILSALWTFGFYSQGPETPVNLGPRGEEPAWVVESVGTSPEPVYEAFASYPGGEGWRPAGTNDNDEASVQSVTSATQGFLAAQANTEAGVGTHDPGAISTTDFTVEDIEFYATDDGVSLAGAQAFFTDGGPVLTVLLRHDSGSVNRYSWMFLIGSSLLFAVHLPFLDRAEKRRKEILTGGTAPPWYGPA
ncbi:MAG TPA: hypothetical protein VF028_01580 [Actinomycetota bacterium]|jgi:hypothetical protein|nr:hypothetical protein [Actinomycetota bacterium]